MDTQWTLSGVLYGHIVESPLAEPFTCPQSLGTNLPMTSNDPIITVRRKSLETLPSL